MLSSDSEKEALAKRTITLYNRTHTPNARVTLVKLVYPLLVVEFTGIICTGCSTQNVTEAFEYQFRALAHEKSALKTVKNTTLNSRTFQVIYSIQELLQT